jgi:hypothetical protein
MAKKKSKKKHKKVPKSQDSQANQDFVEGSLKDFGILLASLLIGQIVEAAIERLLHKVPSPNASTAIANPVDNESNLPDPSHSISPIVAGSVLALEQEEAVNLGMKDLIEAVRDAVREVTPTLEDVAGGLRTSTLQTVQQAVGTAGNKTKTVVEGAVSSAKSLMDKLTPSDTDTGKKLSKKKHKKNKKK